MLTSLITKMIMLYCKRVKEILYILISILLHLNVIKLSERYWRSITVPLIFLEH